jgi:hypothetical protein
MSFYALVAQLVERPFEEREVGRSIRPLGTILRIGGLAELADCVCLENKRAERFRGFESRTLLQFALLVFSLVVERLVLSQVALVRIQEDQPNIDFLGGLAQWLEQVLHKDEVTSSTLVSATIWKVSSVGRAGRS